MALSISIANIIDQGIAIGGSSNIGSMLYEDSIDMLFETGIVMDYESA